MPSIASLVDQPPSRIQSGDHTVLSWQENVGAILLANGELGQFAGFGNRSRAQVEELLQKWIS